MRKSTFKLRTLSFAVMALCFIASVSAQINSATELYGTYEFTADVEVTPEGEQYADLFSGKCDVKVTSDEIYDFSITGIGGSTGGSQTANWKSGVIRVMSPNGSNYYLWGKPVLCANANGDSPYAGDSFIPEYTVDPETKTITIPDFTAITVDATWSVGTVLAKFTNCKMTFKESEIIEVNDISGNYHFTAVSFTNEESSFPTEFDMTLAATNGLYTAYKVSMDFGADYLPFTLDATFDGDKLTIPFKDVYLNEEKTLALSNSYKSDSLAGEIEFKYVSDKALRLDCRFSISKDSIEGEGVGFGLEQFYIDGTAAKPVENADNFAGTYHVVCGQLVVFIEDDEYNYTYPTEFDITVEKGATNDKYYVHKFMNGDIYAGTYGYYPCVVEGNTLRIPVGDDVYLDNLYISDDYDYMVDHVLYNGMGENEGYVDLTVNEDGTCTLGDFFLYRKVTQYAPDWSSSETVFEQVAYYGSLSVASGVEEVKAGRSGNVYAADGAIYVSGEPAMVKVYNMAGVCVFSGVTSVVNGLNHGLYIVKCGDTTVKVAL